MNKTKIEWTHRPGTVGMTWNPIRARTSELDHRAGSSLRTGTFCTRISPGCLNCYASTINKRFGTGEEYTVPNLAHHEFYTDPRIAEQPLQYRKPATIFVGDMFDLFHEAISDDMIMDVVRVMEVAAWHTFQVLTKRTARMQKFFSERNRINPHLWPAPNVWLGTSVESQKYADERIPLLLQTPAAVRFLSVEPQIEAVDLTRIDYRWQLREVLQKTMQLSYAEALEHVPNGNLPEGNPFLDVLNGKWFDGWDVGDDGKKVDWVICGGESGPGARPFNLAWAESLLKQCKEAGVSFFMKQVGSNPHDGDPAFCDEQFKLKDRKGGDMSEWPEHLRVREFPR